MGTCHDGTPKFKGICGWSSFFQNSWWLHELALVIRVTRKIIAARSQNSDLQLESQLLSGGGYFSNTYKEWENQRSYIPQQLLGSSSPKKRSGASWSCTAMLSSNVLRVFGSNSGSWALQSQSSCESIHPENHPNWNPENHPHQTLVTLTSKNTFNI